MSLLFYSRQREKLCQINCKVDVVRFRLLSLRIFLTCLWRHHEECLPNPSVSRHKTHKLIFREGQRHLGNAQPSIGGTHTDGDLLVLDKDILSGRRPLVQYLWSVQRKPGASFVPAKIDNENASILVEKYFYLQAASSPSICTLNGDAHYGEVREGITDVLENK